MEEMVAAVVAEGTRVSVDWFPVSIIRSDVCCTR